MAETKTQADKANDTARKDAEKAEAARVAAADAELSDEERAARDAEAKADNSAAKAQALRESEDREASAEAQVAEDTKNPVGVSDPGREIGDHHAQKFANDPENPQLAPGLDPNIDQKDKVRMEITDSDHPDPKFPKVAYVHEKMVGDYQRAGWRLPVA